MQIFVNTFFYYFILEVKTIATEIRIYADEKP